MTDSDDDLEYVDAEGMLKFKIFIFFSCHIFSFSYYIKSIIRK